MTTERTNQLELTKEQKEVVDFAKTGHNLCIFGKAGVGKTTAVDSIKKYLTTKGIKYQIICSSGISCDAYHGAAKTVHSHYGLQTAELPANMVIDRSMRRQNIVKEISDAKVVIWDEISMSSSRIFHVVNAIHHLVFNNNFPFGGIQMILVGDFRQLKPIPGPLDAGSYIFTSQLFNEVFPHRFELQMVMRQGEGENKLKEALDSLRAGECDGEVEEYFQYLERELDNNMSSEAINIYFNKLPVEIHNLNALSNLPGEITTFESDDIGNAKYLESTVSKVLALKPGCEVMLLYNINEDLRNGYRGQYVGVDPDDEDRLVVNFPNVGRVGISRKTWHKYDVKGRIQASRTQFPLSLCYAITVHKAQSLTLDSVIVHCSQEFVPFQTYVAISRVKKESHLQILGFRKKFLLRPPPDLLNLVVNDAGVTDENFVCCKGSRLDERWFECEEHDEEDNMDAGALADVQDLYQYFETNDGVQINLEDVLLCMSDFSNELTGPPPSFCMKDFLQNIIGDISDDSYSKSVKSAANYAANNLKLFELFVLISWRRIYVMFQNYLTEHLDELHMTSKDFTNAISKLHQLFLSQEYRSDMISAFGVEKWCDISDGQRSLGVILLFNLFQLFTAEVGKLVRKQEELTPIPFNVSEMGPDGRAKLRYVGGWAIKKLIDNARRYVNENKMSQSGRVRTRINKEMLKLQLLENNIVVSHECVQISSAYPETLDLIEFRQYRGRGLIHISDDAFEFFMLLEQERVNKINTDRLSSLQNSMVDDCITKGVENSILQAAFVGLFRPDGDANKEIILELFKDVIERYFRMGAGQFLRDFRKDYHVKKTVAHRKAVMQRKEKAEEKRMKVNIREIELDRSFDKRASHGRLLALLSQVKEAGIARLYKKEELRKLCDAYNVHFTSRWNKQKLAMELCHSIPRFDGIPSHQITSRYAVNIVEPRVSTSIPVLRITRL